MEASSYMAALSYGDPKPSRLAYIVVKLGVSHAQPASRTRSMMSSVDDIFRQTRVF